MQQQQQILLSLLSSLAGARTMTDVNIAAGIAYQNLTGQMGQEGANAQP